VGNRVKCAGFEFDRRLKRLDQPVDRSEWEMPAHSVNAYYNPLLNEIVFPAGILQPPLFYADADDAVNYGGIGTVIGHEITHGFDDNGSQFDENGARRNWWTDEDRTEFQRRADVLVEQFSRYEIAPDQTLNGRLTLGENIADLGGLAIAYDAFTSHGEGEDIDGFTPAQRFFLSYATIWRMNYTDEYLSLLARVDVHAPNQFRVNGPLSNLPAFSEVFDVPDGSPMTRSPQERAKVW
jgi:putative endopeptidase